MCGIIHCKKQNKNEKANKLVIKRFEKQRSRGTQGFGYVEIKSGIVVAEVRTQTEKEIMEKLEKSEADEIMFHHRLPTSTPNIIESTHPIRVFNDNLKYGYYVVHNGVIRNDDELREQHVKAGFEYTTELKKQFVTNKNVYSEIMWNDSEAVAIDFCQAIETGKKMTSEGSIAIVALQFEKDSGKAIALYFGRNEGNPLKIENEENFLSISSESGKDLKSDTLYRYDYAKNTIEENQMDIGLYQRFDYWENYYNNKYGNGKEDENDFQYDNGLTGNDDWEEDENLVWEEEEARAELLAEIEEAIMKGDEELANSLQEDLLDLEDEIETRRIERKYGRF